MGEKLQIITNNMVVKLMIRTYVPVHVNGVGVTGAIPNYGSGS